MPRELHDHFFKQAKRDGYRSRAAYKLMQIDDKRRVLHSNARVLDCGCAPGSWLQVAASRVGPNGIIVGIDLTEIPPLGEPNVFALTGDLTQIATDELLDCIRLDASDHTTRFDVVLSDMAPKTTGDRNMDHHGSMRLCAAVLGRCDTLLMHGGSLVMKAFEGEAYPDLLRDVKSKFGKVKGFRPPASRHESTEMFVIAQGFARSGPLRDADDDAACDSVPLAPPRPPRGWNR